MTKIPTEILTAAQNGGWYAGYSCQKDPYTDGYAFTAKEDITREQYKEHQLIIISWQEVALDREFWIALGKKLGWQMVKTANYGAEVHTYWAFDSEWQAKAHEFYQCVLSGQDPTEWWNELLANRKGV